MRGYESGHKRSMKIVDKIIDKSYRKDLTNLKRGIQYSMKVILPRTQMKTL